MPVPIVSNYDMRTRLPLDTRFTKVDSTSRFAIPNYQRYDGMFTYEISTQKTFQLRGGLDDSNWVEMTPIAGLNTLGMIQVGSNLSIDINGVLSATGGAGDSLWEDDSTIYSTSNGDCTGLSIGGTPLLLKQNANVFDWILQPPSPGLPSLNGFHIQTDILYLETSTNVYIGGNGYPSNLEVASWFNHNQSTLFIGGANATGTGGSNYNGGSIVLQPGDGLGSGSRGVVQLASYETLVGLSNNNNLTISATSCQGFNAPSFTIKGSDALQVGSPPTGNYNGGDLLLQAGAGCGVGIRAGNVSLIAGNPVAGDSTSAPGAVYLVPGNDSTYHVGGIIYLGNDNSIAYGRYMQAAGNATDIPIHITAKGTGSIILWSSGGGAILEVRPIDNKIMLEALNTELGQQSYATHHLYAATNFVQNGADLFIHSGDVLWTGIAGITGGNLYLYPGKGLVAPHTTANGVIYLGDGSIGCLSAKTAETNVIYYDPTTGLLTYGVAGSSGLDPYAPLILASPVVWDTSSGLNKTFSASSDFTLSLTSLANGMSGDLRLDITGPVTITLPTSKLSGNVTSLVTGIYHLAFTYDGVDIEFNIGLYV